jgi:hypothetical protein
VGEYPSDTADTWTVIGEDAWRALAAAESAPSDPVAFAVDMTPERTHVAIAVAGEWRGGTHVEVVEHRPGTGWFKERARDLTKKWGPRCWVIDPGSPAGALIGDLTDALKADPDDEDDEPRLLAPVVQTKTREIAQATGQFYDAVTEQALSHLDQAPLAAALAGAQKRALGDSWAWARRIPSVDISPLVAATLAKWGLAVEIEEESEGSDPWVMYG